MAERDAIFVINSTVDHTVADTDNANRIFIAAGQYLLYQRFKQTFVRQLEGGLLLLRTVFVLSVHQCIMYAHATVPSNRRKNGSTVSWPYQYLIFYKKNQHIPAYSNLQ